MQKHFQFPSPTGVTYYEYYDLYMTVVKTYDGFRPQQGLPIMNKKAVFSMEIKTQKEFPSPTGVTYYELFYPFVHLCLLGIMVSVPNRG